MTTRIVERLAVPILALFFCTPALAQTGATPGNYVIGPSDVLQVAVWGQEDVGGQFTVERDGTFTFPLIGRVTAAGLTLREFEESLRGLLADGLFRNPQVSVAVAEYRSQRIFVVGEVRQPGTYPLTGNMNLMDALAGAGSTTANAANELLVVRSADAEGPVLPAETEAAEVITVDLNNLQGEGRLQNLVLRDGDTVFVPRAAIVYVSGNVRNPGSYAINSDTSVLQAITLAGGATPFGALNRITIVRRVDDGEEELRVDLQDRVQPNDTIIVPERFF